MPPVGCCSIGGGSSCCDAAKHGRCELSFAQVVCDVGGSDLPGAFRVAAILEFGGGGEGAEDGGPDEHAGEFVLELPGRGVAIGDDAAEGVGEEGEGEVGGKGLAFFHFWLGSLRSRAGIVGSGWGDYPKRLGVLIESAGRGAGRKVLEFDECVGG